MPFGAIWMDLQGIMLSNIRQTESNKYHIFLLLCGIWKKNKQRKQNRNKIYRQREQIGSLPEGRGLGGLSEIMKGMKR